MERDLRPCLELLPTKILVVCLNLVFISPTRNQFYGWTFLDPLSAHRFSKFHLLNYRFSWCLSFTFPLSLEGKNRPLFPWRRIRQERILFSSRRVPHPYVLVWPPTKFTQRNTAPPKYRLKSLVSPLPSLMYIKSSGPTNKVTPLSCLNIGNWIWIFFHVQLKN